MGKDEEITRKGQLIDEMGQKSRRLTSLAEKRVSFVRTLEEVKRALDVHVGVFLKQNEDGSFALHSVNEVISSRLDENLKTRIEWPTLADLHVLLSEIEVLRLRIDEIKETFRDMGVHIQ